MQGLRSSWLGGRIEPETPEPHSSAFRHEVRQSLGILDVPEEPCRSHRAICRILPEEWPTTPHRRRTFHPIRPPAGAPPPRRARERAGPADGSAGSRPYPARVPVHDPADEPRRGVGLLGGRRRCADHLLLVLVQPAEGVGGMCDRNPRETATCKPCPGASRMLLRASRWPPSRPQREGTPDGPCVRIRRERVHLRTAAPASP